MYTLWGVTDRQHLTHSVGPEDIMGVMDASFFLLNKSDESSIRPTNLVYHFNLRVTGYNNFSYSKQGVEHLTT